MSDPAYRLHEEPHAPLRRSDSAEADGLRREINRLKSLIVQLSTIIAKNAAAENGRLERR